MTTKEQLKLVRDAKVSTLEALAARMNRSDSPSEHDAEMFDELKRQVGTIDAQMKRLSDAARRAARAIPVGEDIEDNSRRWPSKAHGFKDVATAYRAGLLLGTILGSDASRARLSRQGVVVQKAQGDSSNAAGATLVPEDWLNVIIDLKEQYSAAMNYPQQVMMTRDTMKVPRRTQGVTAYFPGEGNAPTESIASFDEVSLQAKKMASLVKISTELAEDSMINVASYVTQEMAYAASSKLDDCLFLGDGTSTYGGMVGLKNAFANIANAAGIYQSVGRTSLDALDARDISMWMGLLPQFAVPTAKFYCSQSFFSTVFRRLASNLGGNTIQTLSGDIRHAWAGKEIVISQKLPVQTGSNSGQIVGYYGAMEKAVMHGSKRETTIRRSDERFFDQDSVGLLCSTRADVVVHDIGTASAAGPLVALKLG
jgi:HK97 family phage major capsid protein